ncbi:beta-ketoacyl-ACP synthase [Iningainema tapete]|uniref:Beta-ketoacyl-ACP synthase n=1 Tax=Iningainema tapete BLCC-T55 TaxID=2748662 RepID=A0A8J7BYU8_9CYAN|nr:beta-ketoacyl-ACP synthase [Iningainema tapete]MBD2776372.1 beta-ketoacyl-ACP synthase [Iningainema tapete BLCC-T55]
MVSVVVTGIGLVCALGESLEYSWKQLIAGKSGINRHQPFPALESLPLGLIGTQPANIRMLTQLVVASALADAQLVPPLPDCGVVIGSSRSFQADWEEMARQMEVGEKGSRGVGEKNIQLWLDTLPHMNAIATAQQIGASGVVLAPMAACATGIWAIAQAVNLVQTGVCERVIAGAVEAPISPLTITGFKQMQALAQTGAYPFDLRRSGFVLGEGAAVFVLESAQLAASRQAKVYGQILGFGLTADAYHAYAPQPEGRSAIAAVRQCLDRSHLTPSDIDYIHAHGTGTQLNDSVESLVIQRIFPQRIPVSSTKGATGHTLGASGALGVAFSLMALRHQILPPTVGLLHPEFDLELVRTASGSKIRNVLSFSFGFGGQNAAIAFCHKS